MEKDFKKGDVIEFCGCFYEVEVNKGTRGTVWELNNDHERTGEIITAFYWLFDGEECKLVKRA